MVSIRITPKMRFGLQLLSNRLGRSYSDLAVMAIQGTLDDLLTEIDGEGNVTRRLELAWSPAEHERVVRTALHIPDGLSDRERYIWQLIREGAEYWKAGKAPPRPSLDDVDLPAVARRWEELKKRASA